MRRRRLQASELGQHHQQGLLHRIQVDTRTPLLVFGPVGVAGNIEPPALGGDEAVDTALSAVKAQREFAVLYVDRYVGAPGANAAKRKRALQVRLGRRATNRDRTVQRALKLVELRH